VTVSPDREATSLREALVRLPEAREAAVFARGALCPGLSAAVVPTDYATGPELVERLAADSPGLRPPELIVLLPEIPTDGGGNADVAVIRDQLPWWPSVYRFEPPANDIEHELAAIWAAALGRDLVGVHDDFIDCGGDSLVAAKILNTLGQRHDAGLSVGEFFELATIRRIGQRLAR
jgi:hypothetical protein